MKKYGKTTAEKNAEKSLACRQIVSEILNFGVDEAQKIQIIKLLACELENASLMKEIASLIKDSKSNDKNTKKELFIT